MKNHSRQWTLGIEAPTVHASAANFHLPSWPPPDDFPVVVDEDGATVSRYGDSEWKLWPWAGRPRVINFGDGPQRKKSRGISSANACVLRLVAAWWVYGPRPVRSVSTLVRQFGELRHIMAHCTTSGLICTDLSRHKSVIDELARLMAKSRRESLVHLMHQLYEARDVLGFVILDAPALRQLAISIPKHTRRQTAYIPPRIWAYQTSRLREFLEDYISHETQIRDCFELCLKAYTENNGSAAAAVRPQRLRKQHRNPFENSASSGVRTGVIYQGRFSDTAKRFGIDKLLLKWVDNSGKGLDGSGRGVSKLSSYLNMAGYVGTAYLITFSLMRIDECWNLRHDCLEVEKDEHFGSIYMLKGSTTKTMSDPAAVWVAAPGCTTAVAVMRSVSSLRTGVARQCYDLEPDSLEFSNPYLVSRAYEPWARKLNTDMGMSVRPICASYKGVLSYYPLLLDEEEIRITEADLRAARQVTPTLERRSFAVGKPWPFAWHQLRRSGAVNMLASGVVSDSTLQYQLKHASRAMSLYYGQGYSRRNLDRSTRDEYVRTMYEMLGTEVRALFSERWVSPHGQERKAAILEPVTLKDSQQLTRLSQQGRVNWRETLFGGCVRRGPCEFGGIDNFVRCSGGDGRGPCPDALFDRDRATDIEELGRLISLRLVDAVPDSPYAESLRAQQKAVQNALGVIKNE